MLDYQRQDSQLTLAQGLREYRQANPELIESSDPPSAEMLRRHDAAHVVFGCSTDLRGEVLIHAWTVFATTQSIREAHDASRVMEHRQLFAELGWEVARTAATTIPGIARAVLQGLRMTRKWPYHDFEAHLDRPLAEIRREFGIRVVE